MSSASPSTRPSLTARCGAVFVALCSLWLTATASATIDSSLQMQTGNPSSATADTSNHSHYLVQRAQFAMDYNDTTREPNWVAWDLTTGDVGGSGRSNFIVDSNLPSGFYQVLTTDYSGSGYDRGHMCPSADRTVTTTDNQQVFVMSNMIPQSPDNNQGVWASFEGYCRTQASAGNEILIISGPSIFNGSTIASGVAIPGYTWKIALVVPLGSGTALSRVTASTRVIAIKIPNIAGVRNTPWQNFVTSVAQIQTDTGYTFFSALPASVANALRIVVDGQSNAGAPAIVAQPGSQTTVVGGSATFSVTASGDATLTYQWSHDENEIAGATSDTLTLNNVQAADVGNYTVVVTNSLGSATSNAAALIVGGLPPSITNSPVSETVNAGSSVTFSVTASGSPTLTYQWRKGGTAISGNASATTSALTLTNVQAADIASYDVVVTNGVGSAISGAAALTVNPAAPTITVPPSSRTASTGSNASFSVTASGTSPLSYQWRKGGSNLTNGGVVSGATTATLVLTAVSAVDGASYDVVVTNSLGSATSTAATLTVNPPPPSTVTWDFTDTTGAPASGLTTEILGPGIVTQGNNNGTTTLITNSSVSGSYTGASAGNNAGAAARIGALNKAASGSAYFEFTLNAVAGKRLLASGISFGMRSTSTGPQAFSVFTSLDSFTTAIATGTVPANGNWAFYTPTFSSVTGATGGAITFRIYGYNGAGGATANTANWRVDDLKLTVTTVFPPPVAPVVISTTPTAGTTAYTVSSPITIAFNEAVSFTGSWFTITSAANGPIAATVTGGPTTYTLTPPSYFAYGDTISVSIDTTHVVDQSTGSIPGTTTTNFSFTTETYVPPTPPHVTTQPVAQSVNVGGSVSFTVVATGTAPLSYQWRKGGVAITGNSSAATATLSLSSVTLADAASYDCVVSNIAGSDLSSSAALTVTVVPPTITTQPIAQMAGVGGSASFTVAASGTAPFAYQWRKGGVALTGNASATTATLSLGSLTYVDTGSYDVVVSNTAGSATSTSASLVVSESAPTSIYWDFATAAPTSGIPAGVTGGTVTQGNNNGSTVLITASSVSSGYSGASGTNNAGAAARIGALNQGTSGSAYFEFTFTPSVGRQFSATAIAFGSRSTGTGPAAYALYTSLDNYAAPIASGTFTADSTWRLSAPTFKAVTSAAGTGITFRLFGFNGTGSPASGTANWRIDDVNLTAGVVAIAPVAPSIATQPVAQTATVGGSATFFVGATGTAPLAYQWRKGGVAITGNSSATTASLTLSGITSVDAAFYDCVISNVAGSVTSNAVGLTVNKAPATVAFDSLSFTYDGNPHAATATTSPGSYAVVFTYDGSSTAPTNAGSYAVTATIDDPNYYGTASDTLVIAKASADVALGSLLQTYTGAPLSASVATNPGSLGVSLTYDGSATAPTNAGTYAVAATVVDANYAGSASGTLVIAKAAASVSLSNLTATYDTAAHTASATTSPLGLGVAVSYNGGATAPINAGSYTVDAVVVDANYIGSTTGTLVIGKATATVALGDLAATYDGNPHAASATTGPLGLTVALTYDGGPTAPTNAGSYAVVATVNDANYLGSATGTLAIAQATAPVALSDLSVTYDTTPHAATVTTTPSGLAVTVTYDGSTTAPTNAGSYAVVATVNDTNYIGSASGTLIIAKATAPIALGSLTATYDTTQHAASITTTPGGLSVALTYNGSATAPTNAGDYAVAATIVDANYVGSASGTLSIAKAVAPVALSGLTATYDTTSHSASATTTPLSLSVSFTYDGSSTAPTNAGSYAVVATVNEANYTGSASGTLVIGKATAPIALGGLAQTYTGAARIATATTTPTGLTTSFTYNASATAPTNAGSYAVVATINDANYTGSATGTLVVAKASASISLSGLNATYDNTVHAVTATTTPTGLTVAVTYDGSATAPTNAGLYNVAATINDSNYTGSNTGTLVIAKATATVALSGLTQTYDGTAKSATAITTPTGLATTITYDGSLIAPSAVGSYAVVATVGNANYTGSASGTLTINGVTATIALSRLLQGYDGTARNVTVTTTPANIATTVTYNGGSTVPVLPGSYAVVATITDPSYSGTASGTLVVTTTALLRHAPTMNGDIDGSVQVLLPEATTLNGNAAISGDLLVPGTPSVQLNGHPFYGGTLDGAGATSPSNYTITLNGNALLRHLVRRIDALTMPTVSAPPSPTGTRSVSINTAGQSAGDYATLRNLTLNSNVGNYTVPAGTYGTFTANSGTGFVLGVAGATTPSVYNFQSLTLNSNSQIQVVGPVVIVLANGTSLNSGAGSSAHPEWLVIKSAAGSVTLNSNVTLYGSVIAPSGTVTINGNSTINGTVVADRLTTNGNGLLHEAIP